MKQKLKELGLVISHKENEKRRALVPAHAARLRHPEMITIEKGYGDELGYSDDDYTRLGIRTGSREEVLSKDIVCDPKVGDAEYLASLSKGQTVFGWVHAVQNRDITDKLLDRGLTAYAWEDMYQGGRHCFWRNNEIAGEAAICHAFLLHGIFPYNTRVAVLGRGNVARGAIKTLNFMGADVRTYDRRTEQLFRDEIGEYDVVVNAILWDTTRKDHIIYREDLKRMKPGAMIVDVSCDRAGGVETSVPTEIQHPDYMVDGIRHYVVDHTPSLFYKTSSLDISAEASKYLDLLVEDRPMDSEVLAKALAVKDGVIVDERIHKFQNR